MSTLLENLAYKAEAKIELMWRKIRSSALYFITEYVKIEDRDNADIAIPFKMWPEQINALGKIITNRLLILLKARQLGLTWEVLAYAGWKLIIRAGYSVVAISKKEKPDAKELVRRLKFIFQHLPPWICREKGKAPANYTGLLWEATILTFTVHHPGGEPSTFQSFCAAEDSGRSFTANLVILDEWAYQEYAKEIWDSAYPLINRPGGGQVIGLSSGKKGTFFEKQWDRAVKGESNFVPIFLGVFSDPRRTKEWLEQTKKDMPNTWRREYPVNSEDAFSVGEGAFFEEWEENVHVIDYFEPPFDWGIYASYDSGFASNACFKWYAVSKDGNAVCFREYYPHKTTDDEQVKEVLRLSCYNDGKKRKISFKSLIKKEIIDIEVPGTPFKFEKVAADTEAWTKSRDFGISTAELFIANGIMMWPADKSIETGWRRLHQWLRPYINQHAEKTALLRFSRNCQNTRRTYPSCESSKKNPEDINKSNEHHPQDCDRYFVMMRPEPTMSNNTDNLQKGTAADIDYKKTADDNFRKSIEKFEREMLKKDQDVNEILGENW